MLSVHGLAHSYGTVSVLHDVDFDIGDGRITGLIGPNGAGKSTLLHLVVGLLDPTSGVLLIDDVPAGRKRYQDLIGFCPDDLPQAELLTGREYLELVEGIRDLPRNRRAERNLLAGLRLDHAADRLVATYSHGMKRKLQLVAALLHLPRVLVLDEPFRGLDPESAALMKALLVRYAAEGNAVFISTHDLLLAEQLCDHVLVLSEGTVLADQSVEALRGQAVGQTLEDAFLHLTGLDATTEESSRRFFAGLEQLEQPSDRP